MYILAFGAKWPTQKNVVSQEKNPEIIVAPASQFLVYNLKVL